MVDVLERSYLQMGRLKREGGRYIVRQQIAWERKEGAGLEKRGLRRA